MKNITNLQKEWDEKDVSIDQLLLDEENIRLDIANKTQDVVITDLFINEQAMQILESIYKNGLFPDEIPVVIKQNSKYIVIDGNRRVVSLKAMLTPGIAPKKYQQKIEKMMQGYAPIGKIKVIVAPSRKDVDKYLAAKHTKTTRRPWSALRRAYFYYAQKENGTNIEKLIERYENKDIPKYIRMYEMQQIALSLNNISDYVRQNVSSKNFEITTLERLYNDKYVQQKLGINFNQATGQVSAPKNDSFDKAYSKIITDIVDGRITSRKEIKDPDDRKKYIDNFVKKEIPSKTKVGVDKFTPKKIKDSLQKFLVPNNIVSSLDSPAIDRVIKELQTVNYRKFPNISADALRSILEGSLKKYFDRIGNSVPKNGKKFVYLKDVLSHAKKYFETQNNQEMKQIVERIESNKDFLEMINHNPSVFSTPDNTKDSWDIMQELFIFIFDDVKKRNNKKK
jgi:hypothetical protein